MVNWFRERSLNFQLWTILIVFLMLSLGAAAAVWALSSLIVALFDGIGLLALVLIFYIIIPAAIVIRGICWLRKQSRGRKG
jgi:hypothetical protein